MKQLYLPNKVIDCGYIHGVQYQEAQLTRNERCTLVIHLLTYPFKIRCSVTAFIESNFMSDALSDTTLHFVWAGDGHRETLT